MTKLAITGVTGYLGGLTAKAISEAGLPARHLARSPERAPALTGADIRKANYEYSTQTIEALTGAEVLFMVSAAEHPQRLQQHYDFIDAAAEAGVRHIVYTSFYNAVADSTFTLSRDHAATEDYIKNKGFAYTFLRDNFYLDFFVDLCLTYDEIRGPAGTGLVSAVVRSDVAQVAAKILQEPQKWKGQILNMTGPDNLSLAQIAEQVGQYVGRNMAYTPESLEEAYQSRKAWPAEDWEYDAWVSTYTAIAAGEQEGVSPDIQRVLGRPATRLPDYLAQTI